MQARSLELVSSFSLGIPDRSLLYSPFTSCKTLHYGDKDKESFSNNENLRTCCVSDIKKDKEKVNAPSLCWG